MKGRRKVVLKSESDLSARKQRQQRREWRTREKKKQVDKY